MAIRKIIFPDNPMLRERARKVGRLTPSTQRLIDDMIETMHDANGVGLAAPQVAVSERIIVVAPPAQSPEGEHEPVEGDNASVVDKDAGKLFVVINPEVVKISAETEEGVEGCLSIPGWAGLVERHVAITVKGLDRAGEPVRHKLTGYSARIFQHEIDHLDGVLFIDRVDDPKRLWRINDDGERIGPRVMEPASVEVRQTQPKPAAQATPQESDSSGTSRLPHQ